MTLVLGLQLTGYATSVSWAASTQPCNGHGWGGDCTVGNDGASVELGASHGGASSSNGGSGGKGPSIPKPSASPPPVVCYKPDGVICQDSFTQVIMRPRAEDLASFVPHRASLTIEPDGVGIVGAPTNLVADVGTHTLMGTLFDRPVTVRFTPAAYAFDYGDGTTTKSSTGGSTWTSLRQAQLTSTATSHVYTARGTYTVSTRVIYDAAVDWGDGVWYDVIGQVRSVPTGASIRVYESRTALVAHTCQEAPTAPGC